jgi:hypothetical protein
MTYDPLCLSPAHRGWASYLDDYSSLFFIVDLNLVLLLGNFIPDGGKRKLFFLTPRALSEKEWNERDFPLSEFRVVTLN